MAQRLLVSFVALGLAGCASVPAGRFGVRRQGLEAVRPGGFDTDTATDVLSAGGMLLAGVLVDREKTEWSRVSPCEGANHPPTREDERAYARLAPDGGTCDVQGVPAIDLPVTRMQWGPARRLSDLLLLGMIALPYGVSAMDTGFNDVPAENFGIDALVTSQTLAADLLVTALLKVMVRRPRPLTYNPSFDKAVRFDGDARLSFPSGHSSMAFAAASVSAVMLLKRYPGRLGAQLGAVGGYLGAASVASLRVLAGKHFVTDVLAGAALGTLIGLVIPLGHVASGETSDPQRVQNQGAMPIISIGGAF